MIKIYESKLDFEYLTFGSPDSNSFLVRKIFNIGTDSYGEKVIELDDNREYNRDLISRKIKNGQASYHTDIVDLMNYICDNINCKNGLDSYKKAIDKVYKFIKDDDKNMILVDRILSKRMNLPRGLTDDKLEVLEK